MRSILRSLSVLGLALGALLLMSVPTASQQLPGPSHLKLEAPVGRAAPAPEAWSGTGRWWSSSSPWNTPLNGSETIDVARTKYLVGLGNYQIVWKSYGVAFYQAPAGTPRYTVRYTARGLYLHDVPIPASVYPADGSDAHLSILDTDPNSPTSGCVFDFLHAGTVGGSGTGFDYADPRGEYLQRERLFEETGFIQGASTRGSSNANLGGILTSQELAAGQINHALALYVPEAEADNGHPYLPSYTSDGGPLNTGSPRIPESARIRVDPSWTPSGLPDWQQTIVRALQTYGGYVIDQGGRNIAAIDNTHSGYGPAYPWGTEDFPQLDGSITKHMEVLSLGETVTETYDPIMEHPCGNFTTNPRPPDRVRARASSPPRAAARTHLR
jgi:hypothetical protein